MNVKTKIKNDLWRWNYIVPFVKKYLYDANIIALVKHVVTAYAGIRPVKGRLPNRSVGGDTKTLFETLEITLPRDSQFIYFLDVKRTITAPGNILSNFTLSYEKIIHGTFSALIRMAAGADEYGVEANYIASGIETLTQRILESIKNSSLPEEIRTKRTRDFSRMLNMPAQHFDEALQRILFFNQLLWQTRHRLNGLGRLDMLLSDLYAADIADGYMSREDAAEMIADFLMQLSRYAEYKSDALKGDIGQIIVLGGKNLDGSYFCNELTKLFLTEQAKLKKPDPKTLLRVCGNTPKELIDLAVQCLLSQTGSPLFSNDDVVIPALIDFGIPAEDAYQYCTSACWEPLVVGKSMGQNNVAVFDFFPALDTVLERASDITSYEALLEDYIMQNRDNFSVLLQKLSEIKWAKDPLVSLFTDGCSEKRLDVSSGGSVYCNYGITTVALSNVVDSLLNIKHIVFDTMDCRLSEFNRIRKRNFAGEDCLLAQLQTNKHYGHDDEEAISLTIRITDSLIGIAQQYRNPLGGTVKFGLSSPGYNMLCRHTAADCSGRKKGMPYNTHISCMNAAYTEVVCFAAQLNYKNQRFNGNVVDFFVPAQFIKGNRYKFVLFLLGAVKEGFFQMQMNLMDSKTLMDAKAHPEAYSGLIVRVWGFSAYYNDLPESYKDLLIERAKAAEFAA